MNFRFSLRAGSALVCCSSFELLASVSFYLPDLIKLYTESIILWFLVTGSRHFSAVPWSTMGYNSTFPQSVIIEFLISASLQ